MQNGDITDAQITQTVGTYKDGNLNNAPSQARLKNPTSNTWVSDYPLPIELRVDLIYLHRILGIDAHGNSKFPSKLRYPTSFNIGHFDEVSSGWQIDLLVSIDHRVFQ